MSTPSPIASDLITILTTELRDCIAHQHSASKHHTPLHSNLTVKMAEESDERETKPFKFVTGKSLNLPAASQLLEPMLTCFISWYVHNPRTATGSILCSFGQSSARSNELMLISYPPGFDARFPNMNQTKHCWQNYVRAVLYSARHLC